MTVREDAGDQRGGRESFLITVGESLKVECQKRLPSPSAADR